jgi:hypothetical protein
MHALRDLGRKMRPAVRWTTAGKLARRAVAASTRVVHCRDARLWQVVKARATVPLRVQDKYGAV